jgi:hypothetical protein
MGVEQPLHAVGAPPRCDHSRQECRSYSILKATVPGATNGGWKALQQGSEIKKYQLRADRNAAIRTNKINIVLFNSTGGLL